jgi:hypothetical protein
MKQDSWEMFLAVFVAGGALNEMTTRERVDNLEKWAFTMGRLWGGRGFWGRISWLFLGR